MSCNYYHGKCVFLNGKVKEEGCIACPIKRAYNKGVIDTKKDYERPHGEWGKWVISEVRCTECLEYFDTDCYAKEELYKCPSCGARMKEGEAE